jgi:WD40 repeat protein
MATGDTDLQIKVWQSGEQVLHIDAKSQDEKVRPTENIRGMEFSDDETILFVSATDTINAYSMADGSLLWQYRPPRHFGFLIVSPQAIAISPENRLAASFDYGSIALFEPNGELIYRRNENYAPRRLAFSPSGKLMVGADGFSLCVWDTSSGERIHRWVLDSKVFAMAASPTDALVATRELYTLSIYDLDQFHKVCELPAGRGLPSIAFSPTERVLASSEKTRVRLINMDCRDVCDFDADGRTVLTIAFNYDGTRILAGCSDGQVISWDRGE